MFLFDPKIFDPKIFDTGYIAPSVAVSADGAGRAVSRKSRLYVEVSLPIHGFTMNASMGKFAAKGIINDEEELLAILMNL